MKSLDDGKSRLRPVLCDAARRRLVAALAEHTLAVAAAFPGLARTAVVSACDHVLRLAEDAGARGVRENTSDRDAIGRPIAAGGELDAAGGGLDGALTHGVLTLRAMGAGAIVVAAGDLPMLRDDDLRRLAQIGARSGAVVVCPDRHRSGTNALYLPPGAALRFRFGPRSCLAHRREARRAGYAALVHCDPRIAFDLDTPEDYARWLQMAASTRLVSLDSRPRHPPHGSRS